MQRGQRDVMGNRWQFVFALGEVISIAVVLVFLVARISTFGFYLPVLFVLLGVSGIFATNLLTLGIYLIAVVSGWVGPLITPRIGQRNLSMWGFGIVFVSLVAAAIAIYTNTLIALPFAAAAMLWGHYWDAENVMTIPSVVAPAEYRGTASGFSYMFVKLPGFLSIFLFPPFFDAIGKGNATLFIAVFPLIGFLAARYLLPEVYGYAEGRPLDAQPAVSPSG